MEDGEEREGRRGVGRGGRTGRKRAICVIGLRGMDALSCDRVSKPNAAADC